MESVKLAEDKLRSNSGLTDKAVSDERDLWKDHVDPKAVKKFAAEVAVVYPSFEVAAFIRQVCDSAFVKLELKDRLNRIAAELRPFLPEDYPRAVAILLELAPRARGFSNWVLTGFVERFGLDDFETSIAALKELTKYGSSEFAVRPFMINFSDRMLPILHDWAADENEHVRRLAAEGSRPRGVWVAHIEAFKKDPTPVLELLEKLKTDPSKYVQKAVANNLNDISREHPERVIATAVAWMKDGDANTAWIVKRACRTLIKQGRPEVFPIFGFTSRPKVALGKIGLAPKKLRVGDELTFSFVLRSAAKKSQRLAIDYKVYFRVAGGRLSPKVFKLSERTMAAGETAELTKKHSFRPATTRQLYPGQHRLEIVINGVTAGSVDFFLSA